MVPTVRRFCQQVFCFEDTVHRFLGFEEELLLAKDRVQTLAEESSNQDRVLYHVKDWLAKTQNVLKDVQNLKNEVKKSKRRFTWYPNWSRQCRLSRKVENMMLDMKKLLETSKFGRVGDGDKLFSSKSSSFAFKKIMEALKDDAVNMIAVWGMAGVGKTTLVKEVRKSAIETKLFDQAIKVVVSLAPDLGKIQDRIAGLLGFDIQKGESDISREEQLRVRLKREKRILILLDDVWDGLDLKAIGIPYGEDHKGCKVLLTTRREQVCISLRIQKVIRLDVLSDNEACAFFNMSAGYPADSASPSGEIAKECQGLPGAMVELRRKLIGKPSPEWRITSLELRSPSFVDGKCFKAIEKTYEAFQLSYDHLKERTTKLCFLLCALFPQGHAIDVEVLTRYAWGLGLYGGIDSLRELRCEMWEAIENLISSSLLLSQGKKEVKMHKLVRYFALGIASKERVPFMKIGLKEWQKVEELPQRFVGEELEILSPNDQTISSALTEGMKSLKVFALRDGHVSAAALENLTNLRTLHLVGCHVDDISSLGKLEKLEILSFCSSEISELPDEIGELNCLRLLDLFGCHKLLKVPDLNLIRRLSQLEELYFNSCSFEEWWFEETRIERSNIRLPEPSEPLESTERQKPSELSESSFLSPELKTYEITIKEDAGSFNYPQKPKSRILKVTAVSQDTFMDLSPTVEFLGSNHVMEKEPAVGPGANEFGFEDYDKPQVVSHNKEDYSTLTLSNSPRLALIEIPQLRDRPTDHVSLRRLKVVIVKNCHNLASIFSFSLAEQMVFLQELVVEGCHALKQIITDAYPLCFPRLIALEITDCDLLEHVFRITMASFAPQSRNQDIRRSPQNERIELPKLQRLALRRLKSLTTFCSEEFSIGLPYLEKLGVEACPHLSICEIIRFPAIKELCLFNDGIQLCEEIIRLQDAYLLSSLEKMMLKEIYELQVIWKDPNKVVTLQHLSHLKVFRCYKLKYIFSVLHARNLPQLSHLEVHECEELEQIVAQDRNPSSPVAHHKPVCFPNLEELCIMECNKLKSLFPVSVCRLPKLKNLKVKDASNLRELFGHDHSEANMTSDEKLKEIRLPELEELFLEDLQKLIRFTSVGYHFVFPALISLSVRKCPDLIMRFSVDRDDSEGSCIRAEIDQKSLLTKEGHVDSSINMQIIKPTDDNNIMWSLTGKNK